MWPSPSFSSSAHARGGVPFLDEDVSKWQRATIRHAEAKRWIDDAVAYQEGRQQTAALPAFFPVAAKGKLVFRTHSGIAAADLKSGKTLWEHESDWSVDRMAADGLVGVSLIHMSGIAQVPAGAALVQNVRIGNTNGRMIHHDDLRWIRRQSDLRGITPPARTAGRRR